MIRLLALLFTAIGSAYGSAAFANTPNLLPIESFFKPPATTDVNLSPEGDYYTASRRIDGKLFLIITNLKDPTASEIGIPIKDGMIQWVRWANNDRLLIATYNGWGAYRHRNTIYFGPKYRTIAINRDGSNIITLFDDASRRIQKSLNLSRITDLLPDDPDHVLMPVTHGSVKNLWKVNIQTGDAVRIEKGRSYTMGWITDITGKAVLRIDSNRRKNLYRIFSRNPETGRWRKIRTIKQDDFGEFWPQAASETPGVVYVIARPEKAERAGVYLYDLASNTIGDPIATSKRVDIEKVLTAVGSNAYLGAVYVEDRLVYKFADDKINRHMQGINRFFNYEANVVVAGMDTDQNQLLLYVTGPTIEGSYYLYNVKNTHIALVADERPGLVGKLNPMETVHWQGRDGTNLSGYLTYPALALQRKNLPMIVMPHGGPELRDSYEFNLYGQFLASRGYLVFQPNFRGSGGFGNEFAKMGHGQWGRSMQDDITDGVKHLVNSGMVDANRICIFGASYGGYAALAGASFTPDLYQCAVSISGVTDLLEMLKHIRKEDGRKSQTYQIWKQRMGDPGTDRDDIIRYSPARQAHRINIPVLLFHGSQDSIVPMQQSEFMHQALLASGKDSQFIKLENAGHSNWSILDEARSMHKIELFFARHLKGLAGPPPDQDLIKSWQTDEDEPAEKRETDNQH